MIVFGGFDGTNHLDSCWKYQPYAIPAIAGLFNTGVDNAGNALADNATDPHYTWVSIDLPCFRCPFATVAVTSTGGFPIPPWLGDTPASAWISVSADTNGRGNFDGSPLYGYIVHFDLTGFDPTTAIITGRWATDNRGTDILINGASTGQPNHNQFTMWTPFQIRGGFVAGVNTIMFLVNNESDLFGNPNPT